MHSYFAGQPITITVPLVTSNGTTITNPGATSFRVTDGAGIEIVPPTAVTPEAGMGLIEILVPAAAHEVPAGEVRAFRQIEVTCESEGVTYSMLEEYLIESVDSLVLMRNSFQTYPEAMLMSTEITGLDAYRNATRGERIASLVNAHNVLARLRYRISDGYRGQNQSRINWQYHGYIDVMRMSPEDFQELPSAFIRALRTAQIIEGNEALDQFSVHRKRQQGLMSETIGESSMMFRPEKVLNVPVTRRSLDLLRPYLVWDLGIARG